jgi:uncharacterized protein YbjQ (UPF0145 family)
VSGTDPFRDSRPAALNRLLDAAAEGGTTAVVLPSGDAEAVAEYVRLLEIAAVTVATALELIYTGQEVEFDA